MSWAGKLTWSGMYGAQAYPLLTHEVAVTDSVRFYGLPSVENGLKVLNVVEVVRSEIVTQIADSWHISEWQARRVELIDKRDAVITINSEWVVLSDLPGELQARVREYLMMPPQCTCGEEGSNPALPHKTWCQKAGE